MPMGKVLNFGERVLVTGHTESCFYGAVYEHLDQTRAAKVSYVCSKQPGL